MMMVDDWLTNFLKAFPRILNGTENQLYDTENIRNLQSYS